MSALIASRNAKFATAVSELLLACAAHNPPHDPAELLLEATHEHVPLRAGLDGAEPGKGASERKEDFEFYRTNPDRRPTIARILEEMRGEEEYVDQIVEGGHRVVEARDGVYGELETDLSPEMWAALYSLKSIDRLYSHQAAAINHLDQGHNVIVSTSTSSGKSLIYQVPVLKALEADPEATALYIFPTKALAQDQRRSLAEFVGFHDGLHNCRVSKLGQSQGGGTKRLTCRRYPGRDLRRRHSPPRPRHDPRTRQRRQSRLSARLLTHTH